MIATGNILSSRNLALTGLLLFFCAVNAQAKKLTPPPLTPLTPAQAALIDQAAAREKVTMKELRKRTPMVQTYIQNMKPDSKLGVVPASDKYFLSRIDFEKTFQADGYRARPGKRGLLNESVNSLSNLGAALGLNMEYMPNGFMDMMLMDATNFDRQHYDFGFVRTEFLGAVRTQVFDVLPKKGMGAGRFSGRIWVEDEVGNVVRFNGIFTGNAKFDSPHYFHFDSWRTNLQPGVWLPAAVYVEETHGSDGEPDLRAQSSFWGYSLKLPTHESDNASIRIDNVTDESDAAQDVNPLEASRAWVTQAEANVLDRLVQAGVLAPPSDFDKVLETVTNNIIIGNNLQLPNPIQCRILLTAPLESLAVGNTILVSKGLIDVLPNEEDLAAILSVQLAHIVLGHHIDTRYAFNDRLLFPDEITFQRITMNHSQEDDGASVKKAIEFLNNSVYHPRLPNAGLFFAQLQARSKALKALTTPQLGDSLLRPDGSPWLIELTKNSPKLDQDNLNQIAALPLGSHLKVNEWDDKVSALNAKPASLLNARDKTPFEITPVYYRLTRYAAPAPAASANPPAPAATVQANSSGSTPSASGNP
jgi:hypothetical protein